MYPRIEIGTLHITTYSLMILFGLIAFAVLTIKLLENREHMESPVTKRLLLLSMIGFAAMSLSAFLFNSLFHSIEKGRLVFGGITWLGGVLGGFPAMILLMHFFCPKIKGEVLRYFNIMIPGVVLAHAFGRVGCFLAGCCYGVVTDSIFGVSFPEGSSAARKYPAPGGGSLPVLPSQLFEAVFELLLFIFMLLLYKKLKRHFLETFAFSYGIFRFLLEFSRGDNRGATGLFLTPSQIMSLLLILGGVVVLLYQKGILFKKLHRKMDGYVEQRKQAVKVVVHKS